MMGGHIDGVTVVVVGVEEEREEIAAVETEETPAWLKWACSLA